MNISSQQLSVMTDIIFRLLSVVMIDKNICLCVGRTRINKALRTNVDKYRRYVLNLQTL